MRKHDGTEAEVGGVDRTLAAMLAQGRVRRRHRRLARVGAAGACVACAAVVALNGASGRSAGTASPGIEVATVAQAMPATSAGVQSVVWVRGGDARWAEPISDDELAAWLARAGVEGGIVRVGGRVLLESEMNTGEGM